MAPPAPPTEQAENDPSSNAMANGPVDSGGGGDRTWERAWTVDEMRKDAGNWSLAGDAGLLLHLKEFSQRMTSRVHELEKEVDGLLHEAKLTTVRANNVFNDFIMLANTQFVENRVYDEDVSQEETAKEEQKQEEQEKSREQRESDLIPKVKEALALGINVIDDAFEKLDSHVADSDSEDDDDTGYRVDPILEAKDPYINRPLPCLIGTPTFLQDDNVGLGEEEESDEEESDHGSISESEEEQKMSDESDTDESYSSYSDSEAEQEKPKKKPAKLPDSSDESDSSGDLFGDKEEKDEDEYSESDEEGGEEEPQKAEAPKGPSDFASELAKKLGAPVPKAPTSEGEEEDEGEKAPKKHRSRKRTESSGSGKKHKHKHDKVEKDVVSNTDIQEEEEDPFGKPGGLFSRSKGGLFDEDSDEDKGLFDDIEKEKEEEVVIKKESSGKKSSSKKPAGGVSMFGGNQDDDEDDLFNEKPASVKKKSNETKKSAPSGGLFDDGDDEDDDDDLFNEKPPKSTKTVKEKNVLDEDEDDEDDILVAKKSEPSKKSNKPKLPAGAVSMFGGGPNPLLAAVKKQHAPSDDEDNDWSDKSRSGSLKSNQSASSKSSLSKQVDRVKKEGRSSSKNSLFDDDADDSLFSEPPKPRADSKSKAKPVSSLFDNDEDDDGDLFGMGKPAPKPAQQTKKLTTEKPRSGSLFGEDEDEDDGLFGGSSSSKKPAETSSSKKPAGGVSLFGGVDVLQIKKKQEPQEAPPVKKAPEPTKPPAAPASMFNNDDKDEDEDLFGGAKTVPKQQPAEKKKASGKMDLFGDEDLLFGGADDEAPEVDLFGSPAKSAPVAKSTAEPVAKQPPANAAVKSPLGGGGLFGEDEDEDDLFGSPLVKGKTVTEEKMDIGGATVTESTDSVSKNEPVEEEPPKRKKPVGGVSMLGGIDPFAAMKQKKQNLEADAPKPKVEDKPRTESIPKTKVEDKPRADSGPKERADSIPKPKVESKQPKKAAPVDSLFGSKDDDDDDLFGQPKGTPDFKTPPPLTMDDDDDDDEDLFGAPKTSAAIKPKIVPPKKSEENNLFGYSETKVKSEDNDLFGSPKRSQKGDNPPLTEDKTPAKEDEDDLFGSPKETKPAPKTWKPPGGVSMFGGVDPFSAMKKKADKSNDEDDVKAEDTSSKKSDVVSNAKPPTKSSTGGKIGKLQLNLGINPAAMLPGAAPPVKEAEVAAVDFDKPAEVTTLHSANKSRARIQTKRRPPSRHIRNSQIIDEVTPTNDFTSPSDDAQPPQPPVNNRVPQPASDLFGNDDLLGESNNAAPPNIIQNAAKDDFASGMFSPSSSRIKSKVINDEEEDLFGDVSTTKSDKSGAKKKQTLEADDEIFSSKPSAILSNDEDIFSPKPRSSSKSKKKTVFDDEDDLFSSVPNSKAEVKVDSVKKDNSADVVADEPKVTQNEEDDIFAGVSKGKKTQSGDDDVIADAGKAKKPQKTEDDDDMFSDSKKTQKPKAVEDDDDLFGKPSATEKKKKLKKAAKTNDEVLFNDTTDIFSDLPAAKPKEKKKKTTKATGTKSVFKDTKDLDDIFADAPAKPKAKKEKTKKTTGTPTATAVNSDDIFDDPLGNM